MNGLRTCLLVPLLGLLSCAAPEQDTQSAPLGFAADVTMVDAADPEFAGVGRLHSAGTLARLVSSVDDVSMVFIAEMGGEDFITLFPEQRLYMVTAWPDAAAGLESWFVRDQADPCGAAADAYMTATALGNERVQGRAVEVWRCSRDNGAGQSAVYTLWHDPSLGWPLRMEEDRGLLIEVSNIREGAQPPELFQLPPGYTRLNLIDGPAMRLDM